MANRCRKIERYKYIQDKDNKIKREIITKVDI